MNNLISPNDNCFVFWLAAPKECQVDEKVLMYILLKQCEGPWNNICETPSLSQHHLSICHFSSLHVQWWCVSVLPIIPFPEMLTFFQKQSPLAALGFHSSDLGFSPGLAP